MFLAFQALADASAPTLSPNDPIEMGKLVCTTSTTEAGKFGRRSCDDVLKVTETNLRKSLSAIIASYYEGSLIEPDFRSDSGAGFCIVVDADKNPIPVATPVCNIADTQDGGSGERDRNWKGQSCGSGNRADSQGYCDLSAIENGGTATGGTSAMCPKEMSWVRGIRVQLWKKHLADVMAELKSAKTLNLTKAASGEALCKPFAAHLIDLVEGYGSAPDGKTSTPVQFPGVKDVEKEVENMHAGMSADLQFDEKEDCTKTASSFEENNLASFDKPAATTGSSVKKATPPNGYCQLMYARRYAEFQFSRLATCELLERAKKDYYTNYYNSGALFQELMANHVIPCKEQAKAGCTPSATETIFGKQACRTAYYSCYRDKAATYFRSKIQGMISLPSSDPLYPYEKLKDANGAEITITNKCGE
jgi:hypothetical protein